MSGVSWIVGTLREQDELLGLGDSDKSADSRDVFGIGTLRDAIADAFFPGITTQQTRAKYFLFVPAMHARLESERAVDSEARMLELEDELLQRLKRGVDKHGDAGIIGKKSWAVPMRPASEIYWSGLRRWEIRRFRNPRSEYYRVLDLRLLSTGPRLSEDETESGDADRWRLPDDVSPLFATETLELTRSEARFLRERILAIKDRPHTSLLKHLVDAAPGELPRSLRQVDVPAGASLRPLLGDAGRLATAIHGAMLLYNCGCAELREEATAQWSRSFSKWRSRHAQRQWRSWDLDAFWQRVDELDRGSDAHRVTGGFVGDLVALLGTDFGRQRLLDLLTDREAQIKPGRARLLDHELLEDWNPDTGVGAHEMSYRWPTARAVLTDIRKGLRRG
jgi:hypothetical protein